MAVRHHRGSVVFLLIAYALGSRDGRAQTPVDPVDLGTARDAYTDGTEKYRQKRFVEAAEAFEKADRLEPSPASMLMAIRSRRSAGQFARAATLALRAKARPVKDRALSDLVAQTLSAADRELGRVEITCAPECWLAIDRRAMFRAPIREESIYLDAGSHELVARWASLVDPSRPPRLLSRALELRAGQVASLALLPPPEPVASTSSSAALSSVPPSVPPPVRTGLPPWVFWTTAGVALAVGGVAVWSGLDTLNNPGADAVRRICGAGPSSACDDAYETGRQSQLRTNILIATASGIAVSAIVMGAFFTQWGPTSERGKTPRMAPTVSGGAAWSLGVVGIF